MRDMEKARNQMADQVREFNAYLNKVNEENQKISSRLVWIISLAMATLVIGGLALSFFYTMLIDQNDRMRIWSVASIEPISCDAAMNFVPRQVKA